MAGASVVNGEHQMPKSPRLRDVAQYYLNCLTPHQREQLSRAVDRATAEGRPLRVGTACSGTDSPIVVFKALSEALPAITFEHVFSCESSEKKRAWIRGNFPDVPNMFLDVRQRCACAHSCYMLHVTCYILHITYYILHITYYIYIYIRIHIKYNIIGYTIP